MLRISNFEKQHEESCDITILVAVYNHEKYLKTAIDSVLAQAIDCSYEVIIVDDYSTDSGRDMLREMEASLPSNYRIIYRERNYGIVDNFYDAVKQMRGRYFIILEADDYWTYPHKIQKQYEFLEKHSEYLAVSHLHNTIDADGNIEDNQAAYDIGQEYGFDDFLERKLPGHTATLLCRNYFRDNLFDYRLELGNFIVLDQVNAFLLAVHGKTYQIKEAWSVYRHLTSDESSYSTLIKSDLSTSRYKNLYSGCCRYVRKNCMDDEIIIKMENFYIRYLYEHWVTNSEDDPVTAEEVLTELQQIGDVQFRHRIIEEMENYNRTLSRTAEIQQKRIMQLEAQNRELSRTAEIQQERIMQLETQNQQLWENYDAISNATCWKITKPFRVVCDYLKNGSGTTEKLKGQSLKRH